MFTSAIYRLWLERNTRKFQNISKPSQVLCRIICMDIYDRLGTFFPLSLLPNLRGEGCNFLWSPSSGSFFRLPSYGGCPYAIPLPTYVCVLLCPTALGGVQSKSSRPFIDWYSFNSFWKPFLRSLSFVPSTCNRAHRSWNLPFTLFHYSSSFYPQPLESLLALFIPGGLKERVQAFLLSY